MKIGKGDKVGLSICGIAWIIMIILVLLIKKVPDFIMWMFWSGLIIVMISSIVKIRKNKNLL